MQQSTSIFILKFETMQEDKNM